jgi:hypothetical protein
MMTQKDDALGTELAAFVLENTNEKTVSALLSTIWDAELFRSFCRSGTSAVIFFRLSINVLDSFPHSTASLYRADLHFVLLRGIFGRHTQPGSLPMFAKMLAVFNRQFAVVNRDVKSMFKLKVDRLAESYTDFIPRPAKLFDLLAWPTVLKDFEDGMAEFILSLASLTPALAVWLFEFVEKKSKALYIEITGKARTFVPCVVASVCAKFAEAGEPQCLRANQVLAKELRAMVDQPAPFAEMDVLCGVLADILHKKSCRDVVGCIEDWCSKARSVRSFTGGVLRLITQCPESKWARSVEEMVASGVKRAIAEKTSGRR